MKKNSFYFMNFKSEETSYFLLITCVFLFILTNFFQPGLRLSLAFFPVFLTFCRTNWLQFYFFFEVRIIPIFFVILHHGKQFERVKAAKFLVFYTLVFSLPFLFSMLFLKMRNSFGVIALPSLIQFPWLLSFFIYRVFLVKLPVFFFHTWLPKAHVEAPVRGSMILAGILLKIGGYGLIIILTENPLLKYFERIWVTWCLIGASIRGLTCLFISDLKIIVAFSSISHITFQCGGLFTFGFSTIEGSLFLIISHGFSSPAFFFYLYVIYKRVIRRRIFLNKLHFSIVQKWLFFIIVLLNFSVPPFLRFFAEIEILLNLIKMFSNIIFLIIYLLFSTLYSIYIFWIIDEKEGENISFRGSTEDWRELRSLIILIFLPLILSIWITVIF